MAEKQAPNRDQRRHPDAQASLDPDPKNNPALSERPDDAYAGRADQDVTANTGSGRRWRDRVRRRQQEPPVAHREQHPGRPEALESEAAAERGVTSGMALSRGQAASDLPRRPLRRLARFARDQQSGTARRAGRCHLPGHARAVRGGRPGRGQGVRGDPQAACLRARRDPAQHQRRDQGTARGDRPPHLARVGQAHQGRAGRGRPRHAHLPPRRGGGRADDRRADPARPDAQLQGPHRHHAALPDRPDRGDQPVQLPAQPGRAQARAGHRGGQHDRAQAAVEGPADDAHRGRDRREVGRARGRGQHPADDARAGRSDGRRRSLQAAHLHRLAERRLANEGARRQEAGRARARWQRGRDRRRIGRPRLGRQALACRRLQLCRPGVHQRPAHVHPPRRVRRLHGALRRRRPSTRRR